MTLEEQGAYRNLLDECWLRGGPIPLDERILARASGDPVVWPKIRNRVMVHFKKFADGWRNATLDEVMRQSTRRATNQLNYRERKKQQAELAAAGQSPSKSDNARDNGHSNKRSNVVRHPHANNRDNKPDSPDPDPDPDQEPSLNLKQRARS